jgi:cation diffusion facilitator CzcD-associated flavoprotein CzcO
VPGVRAVILTERVMDRSCWNFDGIGCDHLQTTEGMRMNQTQNHAMNVRIADFSNIGLEAEHLLEFGADDVSAIVSKIRRHADLPYVYVVGKDQVRLASEVLSELKAIRSPCYPYALFLIDGADLEIQDVHLDLVRIDNREPDTIRERIRYYARCRLDFDSTALRITHNRPLPAKVDVAIVGAGITGLYAANRLAQAGISFCILEKSECVGGIWHQYANRTSRVNSSESAYRLFEKETRSNRDHSGTREILEDIAELAQNASDHLFTASGVEKIEDSGNGYKVRLNRGGATRLLECKGVILAINDRVGRPREARWENQAAFHGPVVSGIRNDTEKVDWRDQKVLIVGMGAFAVENARTALEGGARHVTVLCRRHGTVCPKIIDYLNFTTPYDEAFLHDKKSNLRNMMYWKKLYDLSGATHPECWMGKIKHDGHTISVSDIWFIGHYLKKIKTITGEIRRMTENGAYIDEKEPIEADIVINAVGFERNAAVALDLSGFQETYTNNYLGKDFMYLADAYIDNDAFNSLFGSSVLEMVKFYIEIFILFFNKPEYEEMIRTEGIKKVPIHDRNWSHYITGAMALIRKYPGIRKIAEEQVRKRSRNFFEMHDLETYIAENKREWIDTHSKLAGKPMTEKDCLPYVF